jgi:predicted nucleic acid-binding protein
MTQATNSLVVDASVAAKWHLPGETDSDKALLLLERFQSGAINLIAPAYILYEVPSAITVATRGTRARLTASEGERAIEAFLNIGVRVLDGGFLVRAAYALAVRVGIAFYDALYVALAAELRLPFINADHKLHQRVAHLPGLIWLADWQ